MALMDGPMLCATCDAEMQLITLPKYEFEEGTPLYNVPAYRCPNGHHTFFTEEQAHAMEARTDELKRHAFAFERKITISGRSLSLAIPAELARYLNLRKGQRVRILPVAKEGILVRTA